jgi:hypothetical protein
VALFSKKSFKLLPYILSSLFFLTIINSVYTQPPPPPPPPQNPTLYINSAHGNTTYGVDRSGLNTPTNFGYSIGNCAHCHEQHASIGGSEPTPTGGPDKYALFYSNHISQTNNFCFKCHTDFSSYQGTLGYLYNRSYSYRAGGYADTLDDILEAFSFCYTACTTTPPSSSSHNLGDISTFINGNWGYTNDSNPCCACHNPHRVQGDPANAPNSRKSSTTRGWPVSRPIQHSTDSNAWGLWGDAAAERMNNYANNVGGIYQAPNAASGYEPDGSTTQDGSNLTDFDSLCTDCHNNSNIIYSNVLGRNLYTFDWATGANTGENHGGYAATYCSACLTTPPNTCPPVPLTVFLAAPYDGLNKCGLYVLSCTDCHEPHGSPNNYLVRKRVNNGTVTVTNYGNNPGPDGRPNKEWVYLCGKCHTYLNHDSVHEHFAPTGWGCNDCHCGGGNYCNCQKCHFHGNRTVPGIGVYPTPLF